MLMPTRNCSTPDTTTVSASIGMCHMIGPLEAASLDGKLTTTNCAAQEIPAAPFTVQVDFEEQGATRNAMLPF